MEDYYDEIADELEFQEFLDYLRQLEELIFWRLPADNETVLRDNWEDIRRYGDEPVFAGLLFDKMLAE